MDDSGVCKYYRWPSPARGEFARPFGGIVEVLRQYSRLLPIFGWVEVASEGEADFVVGHLSTETERLDVFHLHGLMPTAEWDVARDYEANAQIINNLRRARRVVCVSEWVADILRRDMHLSPDVLGHGFDWEMWQEVPRVTFNDKRPKVLWNKTRNWGVCDPTPVIELARRLPRLDIVTTFLPQGCDPRDAPSNVKVTGLLSRWDAWGLVKAVDVYLSTTKETFGVGALEAMASRVPIVGYSHGATPQVTGGVGLLVHPGDYDGLARCVEEALERREELGQLGLQRVKDHFSWTGVARQLSVIYKEVLLSKPSRPRVTVVIPCYNKARFVGHAIECVLGQTYKDWELFVVDDASTDDSTEVIRNALGSTARASLVSHSENRGVAHARNTGVSLGKGEYIWCLDADDGADPRYLQTLVEGLEQDRRLAIVYTGLKVMNSEGRLRDAEHTWPPQYDPAKGLGGNQIPTSCLYRRSFWTRVGGYRQRYAPHGAGQEDADFWFRVLACGGGARLVSPEGLFHYRFHVDQVTRVHRDDWDRNVYPKWHPFVQDGQHPLASQLGVPPKGSWPVRNYDTPEVCVVIPVGPAHGEVLRDALDSVEAQTFRNWELYVVNDTGKELDLRGWPYARVIKTAGSIGPSCARNLGVINSTAPTLVFLDADDYLEPTYLEAVYRTWQTEPRRWVYTDVILQEKGGSRTPVELHDWDPVCLYRNGVAAVTCLYSREMWEAVGGFDETTPMYEDWDLHVRLALKGFCGTRVPEPLLVYRDYLGFRKAAGDNSRGRREIQARYTLEDVIMGCAGCSKPRQRRTASARALRPAVEAAPKEGSRAEETWVLMEYTGPVKVDQVFQGRRGRRYLFGDNPHHKRMRVHPDDVIRLCRHAYLEVVEG